jgi:hypothetical protein
MKDNGDVESMKFYIHFYCLLPYTVIMLNKAHYTKWC